MWTDRKGREWHTWRQTWRYAVDSLRDIKREIVATALDTADQIVVSRIAGTRFFEAEARVKELEGALDLAGKHAVQWSDERHKMQREIGRLTAIGRDWDEYHKQRCRNGELEAEIDRLKAQLAVAANKTTKGDAT
jgi:hypothetical protein